MGSIPTRSIYWYLRILSPDLPLSLAHVVFVLLVIVNLCDEMIIVFCSHLGQIRCCLCFLPHWNTHWLHSTSIIFFCHYLNITTIIVSVSRFPTAFVTTASRAYLVCSQHAQRDSLTYYRHHARIHYYHTILKDYNQHMNTTFNKLNNITLHHKAMHPTLQLEFL